MAYKFDDCRSCRFRRHYTRKPCINCDYGEFYEDNTISELRFDDDAMSSRSNSLVTEDDEPGDISPDDLIRRIDEQDEDEHHDDDE